MKRTAKSSAVCIPYTLIQAARRDVLIQALPDGIVRVYAPRRMPLRELDQLVLAKAEWIRDVHRRLDAQTPRPATKDGDFICIEGQPVRLRVFTDARNRAIRTNDTLTLIAKDTSPAALHAQLKSYLSALALTRIRERLDYWIPRIGRAPNRVAIREQKTRWGSCSAKHNLNFNWKLITAPPDALDYVVVHELCHLIDFNHSPRFWANVRTHMPDYEHWKKWLKEHGKTLGIDG